MIDIHQDFGKIMNLFNFLFLRHLFSLGVSFLVWGGLHLGHQFQEKIQRYTIPFAQLSYGVYLIHPVIMMLIYKFAKSKITLTIYHSLYFFPLHILLSFFLAALLFLFVEKSFLNLRRCFFEKNN